VASIISDKEHPGGCFAKFLNTMPKFVAGRRRSVGGIMVSIAAFQAVDPGSIPGRRIFFQLRPVPRGITDLNFRRGKTIPFFWTIAKRDEVAEWLRRWTANPMGSARVGSNPILVEIFEKNFRYRELNPGHLGESQVS
jgi:hypothetical protein